MTNDDPMYIGVLDARVALYTLLSRLYTYPLDAVVLGQVAALQMEGEEHAQPDVPSSRDGAGAVEVSSPREALDKMKRAATNRADMQGTAAELNTEATRLFEGPGKPAAPPFGSYYLNDRRLMGPEAIAVRKAYIAERLLPQDSQVPPDHLLLELGFMAALARAALDKRVEEPLLASRQFLAEHLLSWLPYWHRELRSSEPHPFYAGLGSFTLAMLEQDLAWLDEVLGLEESDSAGEPNDRDNLGHSGPVRAPQWNGALEEVR